MTLSTCHMALPRFCQENKTSTEVYFYPDLQVESDERHILPFMADSPDDLIALLQEKLKAKVRLYSPVLTFQSRPVRTPKPEPLRPLTQTRLYILELLELPGKNHFSLPKEQLQLLLVGALSLSDLKAHAEGLPRDSRDFSTQTHMGQEYLIPHADLISFAGPLRPFGITPPPDRNTKPYDFKPPPGLILRQGFSGSSVDLELPSL